MSGIFVFRCDMQFYLFEKKKLFQFFLLLAIVILFNQVFPLDIFGG